MHKTFQSTVHIRFAHCDPAGIVYHPQYIMLVNGVIEDFFEAVIGVPYMSLVGRHMGFPVVSLATEFVHPSIAGDILTAKLWIEKLGRSSVRYAVILTDKYGQERVRMVETTVIVAKDSGVMKSTTIPQDIRTKMLDYVNGPEDEPLKIRC